MDSNAWDLVENEPKEKEKRTSTTASISKSKRESQSTFGVEAEEITVEEDQDNLVRDEPQKEERQKPYGRSKSPAVESLRKISSVFLQKVGLKTKNREEEQTVRLHKAIELPSLPLDNFCHRPLFFFIHEEEKKLSLFPKILSPSVLKDRRKDTEKKCSYLFRSADDMYHADALAGAQSLERVYAYDPYCPVHGSRRGHHRFHGKHLVDLGHSFFTSVDTADNEELSPILYSQAYIAKVLRKRKRAHLTGVEKVHVKKAKHKILVNLWTISVAFLFLFTGFNGLQNLQTTVNGHMGADALCVLYVSLAISSLFVPSFIINRLGCKMTLVSTMVVYIIYMFANFIPRYYSLIPASLLVGVAASCSWAAVEEYIAESGIKFAKLNIEAQNIVIVRFFGYFFMILHLGQVIGNILSSVILINSLPTPTIEDRVDPTCGHNFVSNLSALSERAQLNLQRPPQFAYLSVVGVHLCCVMVALMIVLFFLNALKRDEITLKKAPKFTAEVLRLTLKNFRKPKPLLLIPLTVFSGIENMRFLNLTREGSEMTVRC